jgi:serine phosphatase RsbU (regulator of sigma subunit)/PAS domain-containing protein
VEGNAGTAGWARGIDGVELLVEAGAALAGSLDPQTTMREVAKLTVPRLADLCVIDLLDEQGAINDVAVVAADAEIARGLEALRERAPLDPNGEHPVARVIRSGQPELLVEMADSSLRTFAENTTHAEFMIANNYRSAVVVPLQARNRTLGAISILRLEPGKPLGQAERPYNQTDLELVGELARRAALAIDNARLFSGLRRLEQRLAAILASVAEAITVVDRAGQTIFANQAAADLLQVSSPSEITSAERGTIMPRFLVLDEQGRELDLQSMPGRRLFEGERPKPQLVRNIVRATGEERWLIVRSSPIVDPETGRINYVVNVFENITEVKRAQLAESFMAEASRMLASSMDYTETLQEVARLAVPQIADWCAVDVLGESGEIERVAVYHSDPDKIELAERLDRKYHPTLEDPAGVPEVIRSGEARHYTDIDPDALAAYARDSAHLQLLREIEATAVVIVPLAAPTRTLGAITLVSSGSSRRLTEADLGLAVRLGRRAGTAVENARLYTERARIARTLQRALLPESLAEIPGVETKTLYSAAGELNEVGGDFYDVFDYDEDRTVLLIGDVCGKGPRAAGVTALARHTLRASAIDGRSPTEMLATLHQALMRQPPGADMCTVCLIVLARVEQHEVRLTIALAGHPPPLLISPQGDVEQVGHSGTILGVVDPLSISESELTLGAGETLLLYTDGVIEAGRPDRLLGEEGLLELCAAAPGLSLAKFLERIEHAALDHAQGHLRDDIALLALRIDG